MKKPKNPYQRNLFEDFDINNDNEAIQGETIHAITTVHKPLPNGHSEETQIRDAADNRDSQPVGAGLARSGDGADRFGTVSGSAGESGAPGTRSIDTAGQHSPGETRDSAGSGSEPSATSSNFVIDADDIGKGGLTQKYKANIAAIRIIKTMEEEGRIASFDERKQIAKYVGWGGIKGVFDPQNKQWIKQHAELKELLTDTEFKAARKSVLDAHYTGPIVIGAMYDAMQQLGFTGGRVLESSVGVGNFFGMMPKDMRNASQLHGVELDSLTSRLVAALYPEAKIAQAIGFEDFQIPAEYFDAVIGNPPFGNQPLVDTERSPYSGFSIHNYFLAKSIDKLRPGGIMQVVVSHNFLDANDDRARKWIWDRAALIGAVRLPNTAFKENAGTEIVADILIFQKRDSNSLPNDNSPWRDVVEQVNINPKTGENITHNVNQFFTDNPQFVLGTPSAGGFMYTANEYTVEPSGDIKGQLAGWVKTLPTDVYDYINRKADSAIVDVDMPDNVKVGSFYIDASGNVMQRGEDVMGNKTANVWTPPNDKAIGRMKGMIALRESLRKQMLLERLVHTPDVEIEANRRNLNGLYDGFLKQHGHINNQTNRRIFLDDTEAQLLQALEFDYDKGISKTTADKEDIDPREPSAVKADIFNRRVAFPPQDFMTVTTAKDALLASLNYRGKVDISYMAEVYNKSLLDTDEIIKELGDVVFNDPQTGVVTADEYLSGDVKTKLTLAIAAARDDVKFKRNVEALEKVIPRDKKPSEISVSIGAAFIPADIYQQFIKHISGGDASASYMKSTGQWIVNFTGQADPALNAGKFGTSDLSGQALFQLTILGRGAVVKKTYRDGDGSTRTVVLEKETVAAREKQSTIKDEWKRWLWSDAERADKVAALFNDKMNRIVDRKFDGGHLTFPGMNPAITLLEHQKNGVWRGLQSYQVLYDHVVGAGKTFEMATLAMEMRRLGIARKPLFVVPNHLTLQWRSEFTRLYPGSNILAATPEDFGKDNRERLFSKIITGDWDAVVIGHSSLKKIGLPIETEKAVLQEQLDEIGDAIEEMKRDRGDRNIIRDMEGIRSRIAAKMVDKMVSIGKRSKVVTFDELGIDAMYVDEIHEFKNLSYNSTMDRNPGMGNPNGSAKAFDMFVKTRWLFDTFGDKTPFITATGTPVSNSLVEMYNMQRYMQYPTLKQEGLHVFDAWAKQFGSVENVYEVAPSGSGYRQSTRFAKFTNLPSLMGLYNTFADTVTLDDLKAQEEAQGKRFPVPKMVSGKPILIVAQRSPLVAALMGIPKAETDEGGNIKFLADLSSDIMITKVVDTDRYLLKIGDGFSGLFETEQDARLKLVEMAVSPKVSVDPDSILGRFARIAELTRATKGKVNALSLTGEANKAGLDYRLIDPTAPDFAGSKINMAVDNMLAVYHQWAADKGTQLVFCDQSIPLSARNSYSSKDRRLYVRDDVGAIVMKRGTMHTLGGHEDLPYFIVQRGDKETKRFDVYDAASGVLIVKDSRTKQDAKDDANNLLADDDQRQAWIEKREAAREIEQDQIDEYNNEHDVETEGFEFFTREDIAGISGSAKFSVYDDIKAKLIARGIPEREIAFIHDYSTPAAKDKLFKAINAGEIRFTLGSTSKMGAGTNVQKLLVGLHHIDAPWRPSDLEQREGRIIRRGNELYARDPENFAVFIGRYATEQTYDTRRWQILEHKARGIEQLRNFDGTINEIDDIEGEASNSADMKAAASGDPLILEETKMRNSVRRLEQLQAGHADEVLSMTRKAREAQEYASGYGPRYLAGLGALLDTVNKNPVDKGGFSPVTVNGQRFVERDKAQEAIAAAIEKLRVTEAGSTTLIYRGLEFKFERGTGYISVETPTGDRDTWRDSEPFSPSGYIQRMANCAGRLPVAIDTTTGRIEKAARDAVSMREQARQPFFQAEELDATREKYKVIQRALLVKGPTVPENQKKAVADGIAEQKAMLEKLGYGEALKEFFNDGSNQHLDDIKTLYDHTEPQVETVESKLSHQFENLSNQETDNEINETTEPADNDQSISNTGGTNADRTGRDGDIFPTSRLSDEKPTRGQYATETELISESRRQLTVDRITTSAEAAQAALSISAQAVERFDALVTDKDGKPLAIVGSFKGTINAASVYPAVVAAEAFRIPDAANIYFYHNHPGGISTLSAADLAITLKLQRVFDGSGITAHGILAITSNGLFSYKNPTTGEITDGMAQAGVADVSVPIIERIIRFDEKMGKGITSPRISKTLIPELFNESGLVLLNNQHEPVGFMPISPGEALPLKHTGMTDSLFRAISMSNAMAAVLYDSQHHYSAEQYQNIGDFLDEIDVRFLDVVVKQENPNRSGASVIISGTESGWSFRSTEGVFLNDIPSISSIEKSNTKEVSQMSSLSKDKKTFHEMVAEKLIQQLEEGTAPWQKPWNPGESGAFLPYNPVTGDRYKGINSIYLLSQDRDDQRWMTYKQATKAGAQVRKGEKGTGVQYWKFTEEHIKKDGDGKSVLDSEGNPVKEVVQLERPRGFFATVFNGEQIDGLPPIQKKEHTWNPIERAEGILMASGVAIHHNEGSRAFYRPLTDSIHLPDKGQFPSAENYYATALHELGHSTGHKDRLNRDLVHPFGSEGYAKEELRAEIASMILGDELGIGHDPSQHAAYVGSWIKALKDDPMEIFRAAADAEKIQNYVLGLEQKQVQEQSTQRQHDQSDLSAVLTVGLESVLQRPEEWIFDHYQDYEGDSLDTALRNHGLNTVGDVTGHVPSQFYDTAIQNLSPVFGIDPEDSAMSNAYLERKGMAKVFQIMAERLVDQEQSIQRQQGQRDLSTVLAVDIESVLQRPEEWIFDHYQDYEGDSLDAALRNHGLNTVGDVTGHVPSQFYDTAIQNLSPVFGIDPEDTSMSNAYLERKLLAQVFQIMAERLVDEHRQKQTQDASLQTTEVIDMSAPKLINDEPLDNSVDTESDRFWRLNSIMALKETRENERDAVDPEHLAAIKANNAELAQLESEESLYVWQQENGVGPSITPEMKQSFESIPKDLSQLSRATTDDYRKAAELARSTEESVKMNPNSTTEDITAAREQRKTADLAATIHDNDFQKTVTDIEQQQAQMRRSLESIPADLSPLSSATADNQNNKTYINVPFKQKNEAKELGAKWDRQATSWFIPVGIEQAPFTQWMQAGDTKPTVQKTNDKVANDEARTEKQYLAVPYSDRVAAKEAGAIWDKEAKSWYVLPKADMEKLQGWLPENVRNQQAPAMMPHEEFAEALSALGCVVTGQHPIMDGKKHRIETVGDKIGERAGFYVGHLDGHPAGYIQNNRTGDTLKWKSKGYLLSEEEKAKLHADSAGKLQEREAAQTAQQNAVAASVRELLVVAPPAPGDHKYLQSKQARSNDLRVVPEDGSALPADSFAMIGKSWKESNALREANPDKLVFTAGDLLLAAQDVTGEIRSVQSIQENGMKRFATGGAKQDMFHVVGGQGIDALANAPAIVIGEGYATADTLSKSLGYATVAAFDSGNLPHVAIQLRGQFPDKPFIIAGDNDVHLELTEGKNPGKEKALAAAKAVDGTAIFPIFAPGEQSYPSDIEMVTPIKARTGELTVLQKEAIARMKSFTDFNDLATKSLLGVDGVDRQVKAIVNNIVVRDQELKELQQNKVEKLEQKHEHRKGIRVT